MIEFEENTVVNHLNNNDYKALHSYLEEKFIITKYETAIQPNMLSIFDNTINVLSSILSTLESRLTENSADEMQLEVLRDVYRALRNITAFNQEVQGLIVKNDVILSSTEKIINHYIERDKTSIRIILQFLINTVVGDENIAHEVWGMLQNVLLSNLFEIPDYSYYLGALIYNIIYLKRSLISECKEIYVHIIDGVVREENEYYLFLLEIFVQETEFMNCYESFDINQRLILLSYLQDMIMSKERSLPFNSDIIELLITLFKNKSDCILRTVTNDVNELEPQEVVILLEILASLCAKDCYRKQIQEDRSLLINCAFLLKNIQSIGKESQNHFTPMQKLSDVTSSSGEAQKNPVFGFKGSLIQFLGNAAWKNKLNQDELRELDCIPLLLDCCNIDARNPFITQWIILAIRNLCENNLANQEVIAKMTRQGVVNCSTLQEMGLTLHDDGTNKISLMPLPQNNSK